MRKHEDIPKNFSMRSKLSVWMKFWLFLDISVFLEPRGDRKSGDKFLRHLDSVYSPRL